MNTPLMILTRGRNIIVALVSAAGISLCIPAQAQSAKVEYTVVSAKLNNRNLEALLNNYAQAGWELVEITNQGAAIFKRTKR